MQSLIKDIGKIFQPLLDAVGGILAFFYSIIPNYPIDVALLTVLIMALITPLTVKSTKNMAAMQALGPEMKKLQQKYKGAENRALMNEEMMKLYKEHNVNPASGCLPMLLQMPAFFILYSVIRGITNTVTHTIYRTSLTGAKVPSGQVVVAEPRYIGPHTKMYHDIVAAHGQLNSFGIDFAQKLLSHHSSLFVAIPYLLLVVGAVGLQYLQMARLNARNPQAAQANPQAAMLQKYMPLIFGFIYLNVAAILNVYFVVSSAIRIATQEVLFRRGIVGGPPTAPAAGSPGGGAKAPVADRTERALPKAKAGGSPPPGKTGTPPAKRSGGPNGAPAKAGRGGAGTTPRPRTPNKPTSPPRAGGSANGAGAKRGTGGTNGSAPGRKNAGASTNGSNGSQAKDSEDSGSTAPKAHPRSKAKRERKAR
ncbi:MAG: membrane protein insertase YidC [Acidimicrobiales bacterium]|nr:membrane protein insertase YidC [Acidimicrobiales bacterium]